MRHQQMERTFMIRMNTGEQDVSAYASVEQQNR
jgi:hypothetical protein